MNKPKFTPGPLCDCASIEYPGIGKSDGKDGLTVTAIIPTQYHSNWKADLALYKAAPEMYEALADIAENCGNHGCSETCAEADCKICEILKKARGEA